MQKSQDLPWLITGTLE